MRQARLLMVLGVVIAAGACGQDATAPQKDLQFGELAGQIRFDVVVHGKDGQHNRSYVAPFESRVRNGVAYARLKSQWVMPSLDNEPQIQDCAEDCVGEDGGEGGGGSSIFNMQAVIDSLSTTPDSLIHNPMLEEFGPSIPVAITGATAIAVSSGEQVVRAGQLDASDVYRIVFTKSAATRPISKLTSYRNDTLANTVNYDWVQDQHGWLLKQIVGRSFGPAGELLASVTVTVDSVIRVASIEPPVDVLAQARRALDRLAGVFAPQDAVAQVRSCAVEGAAVGLGVVATAVATALTTGTTGAAMPILLLAYAETAVATYAYATCKEGQREDERSEAEEQEREDEQERRMKELEERLRELEEQQKNDP